MGREATMPDPIATVSTTVEATPAAAAPASAPEVPAKMTLAEEFSKALTDANLTSRGHAGMTRIKDSAKTPSPSATPDTATAADGKSNATEQPQKTATPPPAPTQSSLSAGYAKLTRQTRAAEKRDAELATRENAIKAADEKSKADRDAIAKEREAWQTEQKAKLDELALLDADETAFIEKYAARKNTTPQAIYDKWMRRVLNDGKTHPTDAAEEVRAELHKVKADLEESKVAAAKRDEEEKATADKAKAQADENAAHERDRAQFAGWMATEEAAAAYPLLSKEEDVATLALEVGKTYFRNYKAGATGGDVAAALEYVVHSNQKRSIEQIAALIASGVPRAWHEEQLAARAKAPPADEAPAPAPAAKPAPGTKAAKQAAKPTSAQETGADDSANPEPKKVAANGLTKTAGPKTLTHNLAVQRSGSSGARIASDDKRMQAAIDSNWR